MKTKIFFSILFAFSLFLSSPFPSYAHALLPKVVVEYMHNHPNATPDEIKTFIQTSSPGFAKNVNVKTTDDVVLLIRNNNTNFFDNGWDFMRLGIGHILSGPDHILFVLSFLLVFTTIWNTLKLTSAFTVAHSITLILAGSGILVLSSRVVEPMIAFSIAYVALVTVYFNKSKLVGIGKSKIAVVFFFGLFHGLGFAGLLQELQIPKDRFLSSLLFFNVGIEIGQLIIIGITLPFIYLLRNKSWYPIFIKIVAGIIGFIGIAWGIQRIFGS
ncbi:MAG: HupE/UreJ family protein [Candidatus Levyibacteriota bacterium]